MSSSSSAASRSRARRRKRERLECPRVRPLDDGDPRVGAKLRVELPATHVERYDPRCASLEQAVGEAARRGADVEAVRVGRVDAECVERVRELLAASRNEWRRPLDRELGVLVDLLAGLCVAGDEAGQHERLRLRARLREAALDEEDIEALLHRGSSTSSNATAARRQSSYVL